MAAKLRASLDSLASRQHIYVHQMMQLRCKTGRVFPPRAAADAQAGHVARAQAASQKARQYNIPERLIIYHAGTGRITFLAMLKLTSLLLGAFFVLVVVPSYVKANKPVFETAAVAAAGITPLVFVAYITAPFVTHIHVHLPSAARASRPVLERFVKAMPASTRLTLTTMSFIAKPRYSDVVMGDLRPATKRAGLVNYVRDARAENAARKWYMFRAVEGFHVQTGRKAKRFEKAVVDTWIWDAVRLRVAGKA